MSYKSKFTGEEIDEKLTHSIYIIPQEIAEKIIDVIFGATSLELTQEQRDELCNNLSQVPYCLLKGEYAKLPDGASGYVTADAFMHVDYVDSSNSGEYTQISTIYIDAGKLMWMAIKFSRYSSESFSLDVKEWDLDNFATKDEQ